MTSLASFPGFAAFLTGGAAAWPNLQLSASELMSICDAEDLSPLVHQRLVRSTFADGWPLEVREALTVQARAQTAEELVRGAEARAVVDALTQAGIRPILIKGTPLAYTVYDAPALRPRDDTDLLIAASDVQAARRVLASRDYVTTVHCSDLFSQFEVQRVDVFGARHVFDVHWSISTQPVFADVLTYEELLGRAVPVRALGPAALAPCGVDALLLACVHPVMHHRNLERVLWIYDIHLLASGLSSGNFQEFARRAQQKQIAAICAHQLRLAHETFRTDVPQAVMTALASARGSEPSATYLASQRRWHHELMAGIRALPSAGARVRLLREVLFPAPHYMLGLYGLTGTPLGRLLLPALYVHRHVRGAWRVIAGKK